MARMLTLFLALAVTCVCVLLVACGTPNKLVSQSALKMATESSAREFIAVARLDVWLESLIRRQQESVAYGFQRQMANRQYNPDQLALAEELKKKVIAVYDEEWGLERIRPIMVSILKQCYSQQDVDEWTRFYRTQAGQTLVSRIPQAIGSVSERQLDEWESLRKGADQDAYHRRVARDFQGELNPAEIDGVVAFYGSDVGRDILSRSTQAKAALNARMTGLNDETEQRIKALNVEYNARIRAAANK